jgi:hypothetical protein
MPLKYYGTVYAAANLFICHMFGDIDGNIK